MKSIRAIFVMAALALVLAAFGSTGAEAATYGMIDRLTGSPTLGGNRSGYNVQLIDNRTLTLTAYIANADNGSTEGTKVRWTATYLPGHTSGGTVVFTPANGESPINGGTSVMTLDFRDVTDSDGFLITAELVSASGTSVAANATVMVTFRTSVPLTGVTLDPTSLSIRQGEEGVTLTARPTPANADPVQYKWTTVDPSGISGYIVNPMPLTASPDVAELYTDNIGSVTVRVIAIGFGGAEYSADCRVTVISDDAITEDTTITPSDGGTSAGGIVPADLPFIYSRYQIDAPDIIGGCPDIDAPSVRYLSGSDKIALESFTGDRQNIASASGLNIPGYEQNVASALSFSSAKQPEPGKTILPMVLSFNFKNTAYLDGTPVERPETVADFHNKYRIMKYFTASDKVDISELLYAHAANRTYMVRENLDRNIFTVGPLVAVVDAYAPEGQKDTADIFWAYPNNNRNSDYAVKFDKKRNILYIYDGDPDGRVSDPIILEKRVTGGGGGGGGGCSAGAFALIPAALLAAALRRRAK